MYKGIFPSPHRANANLRYMGPIVSPTHGSALPLEVVLGAGGRRLCQQPVSIQNRFTGKISPDASRIVLVRASTRVDPLTCAKEAGDEYVVELTSSSLIAPTVKSAGDTVHTIAILD